MDNQERIDAYLRNEMNEAERRLFESDLKSKTSLSRQYELTKEIVLAIGDRQDKVSKMRKWETEVMDEEYEYEVASVSASNLEECYDIDSIKVSRACASKPTQQTKRKIWYWVTSIGVAACLAVGIFISMPKSRDINFVPPTFGNNEALYRGSSAELQAIDQLINSGEYKGALDKIELLENEYAITISLLLSKEEISEEQAYEKSLTEDELYALTWRKINVLLALNKQDEALNILRYYRYQFGIYQKDAIELWQRLDK